MSLSVTLKRLLSTVPINAIEKIYGFALVRKLLAGSQMPNFESREHLWRFVLQDFQYSPVSILEFGVWKGDSLREFAQICIHPDSRFYGFDSYLGLPQAWDKYKAGHFSTNGVTPSFEDSRIEIIEGLFEATAIKWVESNKKILKTPIIVHFDADLYSSTSIALIALHSLEMPMICIFDEFYNDEVRALSNFVSWSQSNLEFIAYAGTKKFPLQIACNIMPRSLQTIIP